MKRLIFALTLLSSVIFEQVFSENGTIVMNATIPELVLPPTVENNDTAIESMVGVFDCRRVGHDCSMLGGICDIETGLCNCHENFTGFDCSYDLTSVVNVSTCNAGEGCGPDEESVCLAKQTDNVHTCFCSYSRYDAKCDKPRFELRCTDSLMTLTSVPYSTPGNFSGQVFVVDSVTNVKLDDSACVFAKKDSVYTLQISYENIMQKCGGQRPDNNTHELKFVIQSDADWLTTYDQIVTARCTLKMAQEYLRTIIVDAGGAALLGQVPGLAPSAVRVSNELTNIVTNEIRAERRRISVTTVMPHPILTLGLPNKTASGEDKIEAITGSVKLGDIVVFTIENVNDTFYSAIRGEDCTLKMDDTMEARLIKDSCPFSRFAWTLLQWTRTKVTNVSVSYYLRLPANALAGQPRQITLACRVKMCAEDVADECAMPADNCKNVTSHFASSMAYVDMSPKHTLKRRSVDDAEEDEGPSQSVYAYVKKTLDISYDDHPPSSHLRKVTSDYAASTAPFSSQNWSIFALVLLALHNNN